MRCIRLDPDILSLRERCLSRFARQFFVYSQVMAVTLTMSMPLQSHRTQTRSSCPFLTSRERLT